MKSNKKIVSTYSAVFEKNRCNIASVSFSGFQVNKDTDNLEDMDGVKLSREVFDTSF